MLLTDCISRINKVNAKRHERMNYRYCMQFDMAIRDRKLGLSKEEDENVTNVSHFYSLLSDS